MKFSDIQRTRFIALLESKGWQIRDGTIWSATSGLWFNNSHFSDWSPSEMRDVFIRRAERIAKTRIGDWQTAKRENQEAAWAAEQVLEG